MSWTSLGEDESAISSNNNEEEFVEHDELNSYDPFVQEPNSVKETKTSFRQLENLLSVKDECIRNLQKLINGQREQLYYFLNTNINRETLLELKQSCRENEALNQNENICMALDKFKYDNNIPTEHTLVRKNVSRTLIKIERLVRHQTKLVKVMESGDSKCPKIRCEEEINFYKQDDKLLTEVEMLIKSTKELEGKMEILKIQLKKLGLIEQERIDLVERVHSMPSDQRKYYADLILIESEKSQLVLEIDELSKNYKDLKEKCCFLEETEQELNRCIDSKIADLDLNKIKPGLETHLEIMDLVERGELSLITITKDEKGKLTGDFIRLYNENAEISQRLKDFDKVIEQRDDLKRQIEVLVENSFRLQREIRTLQLASKTDDLLEQLRLACLDREELKTKLKEIENKNGQEISKIISDKNCSKISKDKLQILLESSQELKRQIERLSIEKSKYQFALLKQEEEIRELIMIIEKLMNHIKIFGINSTLEGIPEGQFIISSTILNPDEEKRLEIIRRRIEISCVCNEKK